MSRTGSGFYKSHEGEGEDGKGEKGINDGDPVEGVAVVVEGPSDAGSVAGPEVTKEVTERGEPSWEEHGAIGRRFPATAESEPGQG